jgi:hypothetical protein
MAVILLMSIGAPRPSPTRMTIRFGVWFAVWLAIAEMIGLIFHGGPNNPSSFWLIDVALVYRWHLFDTQSAWPLLLNAASYVVGGFVIGMGFGAWFDSRRPLPAK